MQPEGRGNDSLALSLITADHIWGGGAEAVLQDSSGKSCKFHNMSVH